MEGVFSRSVLLLWCSRRAAAVRNSGNCRDFTMELNKCSAPLWFQGNCTNLLTGKLYYFWLAQHSKNLLRCNASHTMYKLWIASENTYFSVKLSVLNIIFVSTTTFFFFELRFWQLSCEWPSRQWHMQMRKWQRLKSTAWKSLRGILLCTVTSSHPSRDLESHHSLTFSLITHTVFLAALSSLLLASVSVPL